MRTSTKYALLSMLFNITTVMGIASLYIFPAMGLFLALTAITLSFISFVCSLFTFKSFIQTVNGKNKGIVDTTVRVEKSPLLHGNDESDELKEEEDSDETDEEWMARLECAIGQREIAEKNRFVRIGFLTATPETPKKANDLVFDSRTHTNVDFLGLPPDRSLSEMTSSFFFFEARKDQKREHNVSRTREIAGFFAGACALHNESKDDVTIESIPEDCSEYYPPIAEI